MSNEAIMVVELDKIAKQRPRTNFYTRSIYTPTQTKRREKIIAQEFRIQNRDWVCDDSAVEVEIIASLPIPKSASKKKQLQMLIGKILPTVKPDVDNILKLVLDALNGVAYNDDKQIIREELIKIYGEESKIKIVVRKYCNL